MARHRSFSFEFKRQVALDILERGVAMREIARQHSLARNLIRRWIEKYEAGQLTDEVASAGRIAEYEVKIAALERKSVAEERYPSLNFAGFWMYQGEHINEGIPAYRYQLSLDFPIFTGGSIHAEVQRARVEEQQVTETRRQLEAQIVREVKSAFEELTAARTAVDVANQGFDLTNQEVAQAQRRFQAGVTTNVEVITAQDALARASDNQIVALYRFNQARASLARAVGQIEDTYTK